MDWGCTFLDATSSSSSSSSPSNAYCLLLRGLSLIPIWHYLIAAAIALASFLYNFVESHFLRDLFSGFSGDPIHLTYNPSSQIYEAVVSKCRILHDRYLATPWLASPHLQTCFLNFFGRPPVFNYKRQLFSTPDGGTIALDWLMSSDVSGVALNVDDVSKDESTPIVVVIPGLTSDSSSAVVKKSYLIPTGKSPAC